MTISFRQVKTFPHFLYLLPLFFVLHGYLEYYPAIPFINATGLFFTYCLALATLCGLFFLVVRSWQKAALFTFLVMAFHLFFGPAHDALKFLVPTLFIVKYVFILPAVLIGFTALLFYFRRANGSFRNSFNYLSLLLLVLVTIDAAMLIKRLAGSEKKKDLVTSFTVCDTCSKPDIYLLIADSYSGKIPLKEVMRFDNSAFEQSLRQRGFYILDSSQSNYNYTPFTMASMLGMQYLEGLKGHNKSLDDRKICYNLIDENPVSDYLVTLGYTTKNFSIFKFGGELPLQSTSFYKTGEDLIKAQTFLARLDRDVRYHTVTRLRLRPEIERMAYGHRKLNETLYKTTWNEISQPSSAGPRFIYTHIEMPHYPYYYDKEGRPAALEDLAEEKQRDTAKYLGYLQYGNKKYLQLIDHIFATAKRPPVILFMSDHAFREYPGDAVDHRYHFMNFNAVYLPDQQHKGFYDGISTVNQFRVLFNTLFKQNIPLLKDSTSFLQE